MLKRELRAEYPRLREQIPASILQEQSLKISNQLLQLPVWELNYFHVFLTIPEKKEVDTSFIIPVLQGRDKQIVVPKVKDSINLQHFLLTNKTQLKPNKWKIPEPVDGIPIAENKLDVVFVPLLAFDSKGYRVGYGKGYYDRFLTKCRPDVIKIGLSVFPPVPEISDRGEHDVPLDYCLTPEAIYDFSSED